MSDRPLRIDASSQSFELKGFDTGARMNRIEVVRGGTVSVRCADGSIVDIREGQTKILISRRGSIVLHLIDCVCEQCQELRAKPVDSEPR
jgi:hypothetical protein